MKKIVIFILFLALFCTGFFLIKGILFPEDESVRCAADARKNITVLDSLAIEMTGQNIEPNSKDFTRFQTLFSVSLRAVNVLSEATALEFDVRSPERSVYIIRCPDGYIRIGEWKTLVPDSVSSVPAGIGNQGYIRCERLSDDWVLVDMLLPT